MFRKETVSLGKGLSAHFQKHAGGIDLLRTTRIAEFAETALKGHCLMELIQVIIGACDRFWGAIFLEEFTLPHTLPAIIAPLRYRFQLLPEGLPEFFTWRALSLT